MSFWPTHLGPDGGNGGVGGNVLIDVDPKVSDLRELRPTLSAENGARGAKRMCTGKNGAHKLILVAPGTSVRDAKTGELLADLLAPEENPVVLLKGGEGGKGNHHYLDSVNQAPTEYTTGLPGEHRDVIFQLKVLADVGLVGYPNAGKSTFVQAISGSTTPISAKPFTTLNPWRATITRKCKSKPTNPEETTEGTSAENFTENSGDFVHGTEHQGDLPLSSNEGNLTEGHEEESTATVVIADLPGLMEGAAEDRGLGLQFLQHTERVKAIVYYLCFGPTSISLRHESKSPQEVYEILKSELMEYSRSIGEELHQKACCVVLNKMDVCEDEHELNDAVNSLAESTGLPVFPISAEYYENVDELLTWLFEHITQHKWKHVNARSQLKVPCNKVTAEQNFFSHFVANRNDWIAQKMEEERKERQKAAIDRGEPEEAVFT